MPPIQLVKNVPMNQIRKPAVAGQFYPSNPAKLKQLIESFSSKAKEQTEAKGCLLPHAGYVYSGRVASNVVSGIKIKENIIVLGPNHTGLGKQFSLMRQGVWETPLGNSAINTKLADALIKKCPLLEEDISAHLTEHSIEVELPILQYYKNDFSFVPIVISQAQLVDYRRIGYDIASVISEEKLQANTLIIASSDMTHYEEARIARDKDTLAIDALLELDEEKLWGLIHKFDISMCGYAPAIIMLAAAKKLGAKKGRLVKYQTSGDVTGDYSSVVGYAGIIVT